MNIELFGYNLEVNFYKTGYNRHFAKKLLNRYWLNPHGNSHKIGLIKLLRAQQDISLADAKDAIELMFDFNEANEAIIK